MEESNSRLTNLIIDMDGVLWHGEAPVPGLVKFFDTLRHFDIGYILATNNATKTVSQYVEKLARFGVRISADNILTSSEATAQNLSNKYRAGSIAYVVGETGLTSAMKAHGFELLEAEGFVGGDARADVVVVGMARHVCYMDLASATYLINQGAQFVGTNPDVTFPTEVGLLPGAGSILAFLETATGKVPLVIGKPFSGMFDEALHRLDGTKVNTAMVGDRLNTDIAGGHNAGLRTILLLSGISKLEELESSAVQPDWVFPDLEELTKFVEGMMVIEE